MLLKEILLIKRNRKGQFIKGFKHSEEWKKYISKKMKGREILWKDKISKTLMGHPGQKGKDNYFYGKHFIPWNKNKRMPKMIRVKMSESKIGKKLSEEHKRKIGERIKELGVKPPIKKGKNHYCWKGGVTPLAEKIRKCLKYSQWRFGVYKRDDFTCQECKETNCYLEVHHYPKGFSGLLKEYNIKTFKQALVCEKLWDVNNGRTLCKNCHNKMNYHGLLVWYPQASPKACSFRLAVSTGIARGIRGTKIKKI